MAGVGPTDLHELAEELLAAAQEALDTIPDHDLTLVGAPTRAFVAPGPVVLDCCDQLTVHVAPITEGVANTVVKASDARINRVALLVTAARCVPTLDGNGNPPPVAEQVAAARQINADKWALWNHVYNMVREGVLFDRCCDVIWGSLLPLQPSGGCGGSVLTITVCFDGYEEIPGT